MSSEGLLKLAKAKFRDDWTAADATLFREIGNGEIAYFGERVPLEADTCDANRAVQADRIVWLCTDPEAVEEVTHNGIWIYGARIEGKINLSDTKIGFPLAIVNSAVWQGFIIQNAHLKALTLNGSHSSCIEADGLRVERSLFMRDGFHAAGEIRLVGATIGGHLDCRNGHFNNPKGEALSADGVDVEGDVFLRDGFQAAGEVRLLGATIGGDLDCSDGTFNNPEERALNADGVKVAGSVFLRGGFHATGEVSLLGATIGGVLSCSNGHFNNPKGMALEADSAVVKGSVFLRDGFQVEGGIDFTAATIERHFIWSGVQGADKCSLGLESAKIGTLWDEEESWPGKLYLDGLVYDRIHREAPLDSDARLDWLRLQDYDGFTPQPYAQLASVLNEMGHEVDARKILIAKQEDPERVRNLSFFRRARHLVFGWTIGYGYEPGRAGWWILGFILVGSVLFGIGSIEGQLATTTAGTPPAPAFNAFFYSLDTFVPLVDLHQAKYWLPTVGWLQVYHWFHIGFGWLLTTLLVVGLTGLVRK